MIRSIFILHSWELLVISLLDEEIVLIMFSELFCTLHYKLLLIKILADFFLPLRIYKTFEAGKTWLSGRMLPHEARGPGFKYHTQDVTV